MIVNAADNTVNPERDNPLQIVPSSHVVDNKDIAEVSSSQNRVPQQKVIPNAVQTRMIGSLFSDNPSGINLGTANFSTSIVPNSSSVTFNFSINNPNNNQLIAPPDVSVYIGGVISSSTQWPTQAVGGGNFPVYITPSDWGLSDNLTVVTRVTCRNNTGSDQLVTVAVRWRIITFPITAQPMAND